jgi:hypothetical protein
VGYDRQKSALIGKTSSVLKFSAGTNKYRHKVQYHHSEAAVKKHDTGRNYVFKPFDASS